MHITNKVLLNNLESFLFEEMCKLLGTLRIKGHELKDMLYIYKFDADSLDLTNMNALSLVKNNYNIDPSEIIMQIDNEAFYKKARQERVFKLNEIGFKFCIDYTTSDKNILANFNKLNITLVKFDLQILKSLLLEIENLSKEEKLQKLEETTFVKRSVSFLADGEYAVLLKHKGASYEEILIEYFRSKINKEIHFIIEKDTLPLHEFLESL